MIRLVFTISNHPIKISVQDKKVWWWDKQKKKFFERFWEEPNGIAILPRNDNLEMYVRWFKINGRNRVSHEVLDAIIFTDKEIEEYNSKVNDEEISNTIVLDFKRRGAKLLKKEVE